MAVTDATSSLEERSSGTLMWRQKKPAPRTDLLLTTFLTGITGVNKPTTFNAAFEHSGGCSCLC
jgi:hypothetical protein